MRMDLTYTWNTLAEILHLGKNIKGKKVICPIHVSAIMSKKYQKNISQTNS